jgi:predicted  nucleic acid-binding Zn-ribbon protein
MKLQELKAKVYELAELETTQQLKAKYQGIKTLDMRLKASWEKALVMIQQQKTEFQSWLENPPEEYKDLFTEITKVSQEYNQKSAAARRLLQEALATADSIEALANDCKEEANQISQDIQRAKWVVTQADLN